ncbi:hypothetical protein K439DRAFT_1616014 [Ramaria rubella]|nr:hypothetical protein K439DRAFT_1616014 [Ramaria rubella]
MDETYVSAGYTESTDFQVEDQDREHTEFSTGFDAEYQEASKYTEEAPTSGDTKNLHYDNYDGKHAEYHTATPCTDTLNNDNGSNEHQQEQWLLSHSQTNKAAALPDMWWHNLSLNDKLYYEWAVDDPDKALTGRMTGTSSTAMAYTSSKMMCHTSMLPPTSMLKPHFPRSPMMATTWSCTPLQT